LGNIMNRKKRHPLGNRPIIDWDLVLVMEPVILLGAIIGTYLNKILEGKIIIVMLVLLLSVIAHNTLKKALKMHHAEELYIKRVMWAKQKRMNTQIMANSPVYPPGSFDNKLAEADPPFLPKIHNLNTPPGSPSNSVGSPNLPDSPISSPGASPQRKKKKKKKGEMAESDLCWMSLEIPTAVDLGMQIVIPIAPFPKNSVNTLSYGKKITNL